jgi:hypothetical protein
MNYISYISGEKIELEMDLFITTPHYLNNNPIITMNHPKAFDINNINGNFDNPRFIYTCSDTLNLIKDKLDFLIMLLY